MTLELEGKVALVTAAGAGIVRASATALAKAGAQVMVTDIDPETAEKTASEIRAAGGIARSLRLDIGEEAEQGRFGVRANAIGVGVIEAGMTTRGLESGEYSEKFVQGAIVGTPLGRLGTAADIGDAVAFLASRRAAFITGQMLTVDGGLTL